MSTHADRVRSQRGATLVEVTLGLLVFTITALGSAYYRYAGALSGQIAQQQLAGADLAVTLLETWQGLKGSESFTPGTTFSSHLAMAPAAGSAPGGYTRLGAYDVVVGSRTYRCALYWRDVDSALRELGVAVSWLVGNNGQQKTYQLTSYVER